MKLTQTPSPWASRAPRAVLALATVFSSILPIQQATAKEVKEVRFNVCTDKVPASSLLSRACVARLPHETARMELLQALRSTTAFENLSDPLKNKIDLSDRKFSALYPGGGAHLAPLSIAMKYIDDGSIDEASFTYTELDACLLDQLQYNIRLLMPLVPGLQFDPAKNEKSAECDIKNGSKTSLHLVYNGKPITIHFLVHCSGGSYFRDQDLLNSKVFISHDPGNGDPGTILKLLEMYMDTISTASLDAAVMDSTESIKLPPIIMEDLGRVAEYHDGGPYKHNIDMEFLGNVTRTPVPYGHRAHMYRPLVELSPNQKCSLSEDIDTWGEKSAALTKEQLDAWSSKGIRPVTERKIEIGSEVGYAGYSGAVILEMNPELLTIDPRLLSLIYETQLVAAKNKDVWNGGMGSSRSRLTGDRTENLFSAAFAKDMLNNLPDIFQVIDQVDQKYKKVFAIRALQALFELHSYLAASVIGYGKTEKKSPENLLTHINALTTELPLSSREGAQLIVRYMRTYYKNYQLLVLQEIKDREGDDLYSAGDHSFEGPVWDALHKLEDGWKKLLDPWDVKMEKFAKKAGVDAQRLLHGGSS